MKRSPLRLRLVSCLLLAACAGAVASRAVASESAPPVAILGVDPLRQGTVVENHDCALPHWIERGFAGAVLLHIDTHDDLRSADAATVATLRSLVARGEVSAMARKGCGGDSGLFNEGNFVRVAAQLGVVREVVWVMPFTFLRRDDGGAELMSYLERAGFSPTDRATFRQVDGWYRGAVAGIPVTLCDQERLPKVAEPVLVSIDVDFFPFAASYRDLTPLAEIRVLFQALRAARYAVRDVVLAYSVQGGFLPAELRWVGDAVLEVLRDPALAQGTQPPEQWKNLQHLGILKSRGREGEAAFMSMALALLEQNPHDPALLFYAALATARHGGEAALKYAEEACAGDRGYCVGVREIGLQFIERGDIETGLLFFGAAERLQPGLEFGQLELGIALMKAGRAAEALAALEVERARNGAFPSGFLIGALHVFQGDRAAARLSFEAALEAIGRREDVEIRRGEVAAAVAIAAEYFREEGLHREAERLENDPRLRPAFAQP